MAVTPTTYLSQTHIYNVSTAGGTLDFPMYIQSIRWNLTTAATSTWALAVCGCTAVYPNSGSTYGWPIIGTSAAPAYIGATTNLVGGMLIFPINAMCFGVAVPTLSGGSVDIIRGPTPSAVYFST